VRSINNLKHGLPVLAIDLGGTKIISAIVSPNGQLIAKDRCLTLADEGQASVINRLLLTIDHLLKLKNLDSSQLDSISIAAAGGIDIKRGLVTSSPNLPDWHNVPLTDIVKDRYGVSTFLLNDASAAALGEHRFGAGKGVNNLILLTIGTGIGGGIIIDGNLYQGPSGSAGEIGHMTIDINGQKDTCGNIGCLETLVSGPALAGEAIRRVKSVEWLDLGMPEALWILEIKEFGPLTVAIDSYGTNLYVDVARQVEQNKEQIYNRL